MNSSETNSASPPKKSPQKASAKFLKAKKKLDEALQILGEQAEFSQELKKVRDGLLDKFVEEERKLGL